MRIGHLCTIQSGLTARSRLEPADDGVLVVQLKDLPAEGVEGAVHSTRVRLPPVPERYRALRGDVLFRSRGTRTTATLVDAEGWQPAVAMLPLMILRPRRELIRPAFLAWSINQAPAQRQLEASARGTSMRMVPRPALDALEIALPDLATQDAIVALDRLAVKERGLATALADRRLQLTTLRLVQRAQVETGPARSGTKRRTR